MQRAPGLPCALCFQGGNFRHSSGELCRGNAEVCLGVIARSGATRQSAYFLCCAMGLLRSARTDGIYGRCPGCLIFESGSAMFRSLPPCGGGLGRGVAASGLPSGTAHRDHPRVGPSPPPSPTRGEGAHCLCCGSVHRVLLLLQPPRLGARRCLSRRRTRPPPPRATPISPPPARDD